MIDPIILVIGRLLSYKDNRMLPKRGAPYAGDTALSEPVTLVDNPLNDEDPLESWDKGLFDQYRKDVSDNGYAEAITIQGIDQKYHGGGD